MDELFKVTKLNYEDRIDNLKSEAHGKVKSTKYFPIYEINNRKMIFKPLSKTKPLLTPFFAYSEVYWSYIIKNYFDKNAPQYSLAISKGIEEDTPKYYEKGVLVDSITPNDEKMINIYDYFLEHKEDNVNIENYTNYCMTNYDYTKILSSDFIKNNEEIGKELSKQILLSILRCDQNFHYENINIYQDNDSFRIAPPIDFEFSSFFLFLDDTLRNKDTLEEYKESISITKTEDKVLTLLLSGTNFEITSILTKNICLIVKMYPDLVLEFINKLHKLIEDLPNIVINDPDNFISAFSSKSWEANYALFKENNLEKYDLLKNDIKLKSIDKYKIFKYINNNILEFAKCYCLILKIYLISYYNGIKDLENLYLEKLYDKLNIDIESDIEDVDINNKKIILKKDF